MQIEGLNFLKVQKSPRAKSMNKKKKKKKKKTQMKIRVDFQTTKYLVLVWFWERENVLHMNKDGGVNMVV